MLDPVLIGDSVIYTVLVLVVITSILGPTLTENFGRQRLAEQDAKRRPPPFGQRPRIR